MRGARQSNAGRCTGDQDNPLIFSFHIDLHRIIQSDFTIDVHTSLSELGPSLAKSPMLNIFSPIPLYKSPAAHPIEKLPFAEEKH